MKLMKDIEKVPFDSMPPLIRGTFLTKEQVEKLIEPFKDVVSVVRCKNCANRRVCVIAKKHDGFTENKFDPEWFCADGFAKDI